MFVSETAVAGVTKLLGIRCTGCGVMISMANYLTIPQLIFAWNRRPHWHGQTQPPLPVGEPVNVFIQSVDDKKLMPSLN